MPAAFEILALLVLAMEVELELELNLRLSGSLIPVIASVAEVAFGPKMAPNKARLVNFMMALRRSSVGSSS